MLITLKCSQKLVVFVKGAGLICFRGIITAIFYFLLPKSNRLGLSIAEISIDQFSEFFISVNLASLEEFICLLHIFVNMVNVNMPSILIFHYDPTDYVLINGFFCEISSTCCLKLSSPRLLLNLFLLSFERSWNLFQILNIDLLTISYNNCCFLPFVGMWSEGFLPFP